MTSNNIALTPQATLLHGFRASHPACPAWALCSPPPHASLFARPWAGGYTKAVSL